MENESLRRQITDAAGNVQYTYIAHWNIVNDLKKKYWTIKVVQIILTALSAGGFLGSLVSGISQINWVAGLASAISLAINLYMLNFNLPESIKQHVNAANELWEIKEQYKSLIIDFDIVDNAEVRKRRDILMKEVSKVNKNYPGTNERSFAKAQKDIEKYTFVDGEATKVLHIEEEH